MQFHTNLKSKAASAPLGQRNFELSAAAPPPTIFRGREITMSEAMKVWSGANMIVSPDLQQHLQDLLLEFICMPAAVLCEVNSRSTAGSLGTYVHMCQF